MKQNKKEKKIFKIKNVTKKKFKEPHTTTF